MSKEERSNGLRNLPRLWIVIGTLIVLSGSSAIAQEAPDEQNVATSVSMSDLLTGYGELLSQGTNMMPVGPLKLRSYRLEEVRLAAPIHQNIRGRKERVERVFRLTVTGESFVNGAHTIWIDDEPVSDPLTGNNELATIIFNRSILEDGASISVSRWPNGDLRTTLQEQLRLPERMQAELRSTGYNKHAVRIRRIDSSPALRNQPGIEILLTGNATYPHINNILIVQIGTDEFQCGPRFDGDPHTLVCHLTEEQFEKLQDGDTIRAKYGRGLTVPSYQRFGRLNKSLLDK